jgi:uncharacterized protein (DUF924 family)
MVTGKADVRTSTKSWDGWPDTTTKEPSSQLLLKMSETEIRSPAAVLNFWFGGSIENNYKTKWFPTSSRSLQEQADFEITQKFSNYFSDALENNLDHWMDEKHSTIALIVILDQFSRHIYRQLPSDAPERARADMTALSLAERLTSKEDWSDGLRIDEFVFSLMPYRHSATLSRLQYVLECIDQRAQSHDKQMELLQKFRKQTLRRFQHLQDRSMVCSLPFFLPVSPFLTLCVSLSLPRCSFSGGGGG